jgi:hypothetical protein
LQWNYELAKADEKTKGVLNKECEYLQKQVIESEKRKRKKRNDARSSWYLYLRRGLSKRTWPGPEQERIVNPDWEDQEHHTTPGTDRRGVSGLAMISRRGVAFRGLASKSFPLDA